MPLEMYPEMSITAGNAVNPTAEMYHEAVEFAWPRNPTGWVFIGRAVHALGAKLHPSWTRSTPYGLLPDICVGAATAADGALIGEEGQCRYANWLINERGDDPTYIFRTNRPFDYLEGSPNSEPVAGPHWEFACDLSQEEWAIGFGNQRMFQEVQLRIVQEVEAGRLIIGSRPVKGGEPKPHSRDWWFTDNYQNRFRTMTIDPSDPFAAEVADEAVAHHLFVEADGLAALLGQVEGLSSDAPTVDGVGDPSPYLRLMIEVQNLMQIGSATPPKKASVLHEIQSRWTAYDLPASAKLMDAMATLLRSPESQAGRGRKNLELEDAA